MLPACRLSGSSPRTPTSVGILLPWQRSRSGRSSSKALSATCSCCGWRTRLRSTSTSGPVIGKSKRWTAARGLAEHYGARIIEIGARDGHSGAVAAAARLLAAKGYSGMLTVPGDIPLVTPAEITQLLAEHRPAPAFTIAPSRDERGSNAVICSPPDAVSLRFGEDSFFPHLRAAEACGIRPTVLRLPGIALDVDTPEDLAALTLVPAATRAHALLDLQERAAAAMGDP